MANNTFTKTGGSFSRKLSPELIERYFATQNKEANPLSPLEFQAQQAGQGVNLTPGNVIPTADVGEDTTPQPPNYADTFNNVMMSLLKKAQGVDTTELLKRKRALERASLGRAGETTPEELRTLSPQQQSTIRSADVKALSGEIDFNAYELAKAEQQIDNFYRAFEATSKLGTEFADKIPLTEKVKESFVTALQIRPIEDWSTILAGLPDKQKSEVLAEIDYSQLSAAGRKVEEGETSTPTTPSTDTTLNAILDGFTKLDDLTPSEKTKQKNNLFEKGFNSDTPPQWFVNYIQDTRQQSLLPEKIKEEWIIYRDSILDEGGLDFDSI